MNQTLDVALSLELAQGINSKAETPFENAYRAALATAGVTYIQGFLVIKGKKTTLVEHAWLETGDRLLDPSLPHLQQPPENLDYFPAHRLSVQQLQAAVEEAREDYPEDDPLPVYGPAPYEYYGDVMLGGKDYLDAYEAAVAQCQALNQVNSEQNGQEQAW